MIRWTLIFLLPFVLAFSSSRKPESKTSSSALPEVWVVISDGQKSCESKSIPVESGGEPLRNSGIMIYQSAKGSDGLMHAQMCGAWTGSLNAYKIAASDVERAKKLGYKLPPKSFSIKQLKK